MGGGFTGSDIVGTSVSATESGDTRERRGKTAVERMRLVWRVGLAHILCAIGIAATPLTPVSAHAQGFTLIGFVRDELGQPVEGVEILVGAMETRATTDGDGRFAVRGQPLGLTYIAARRIGYLPLADLVRLTVSDSVSFVMEHIGQRMDTVRVRARAEAAWERDVRRYESAINAARSGAVLTDRDISRLSPVFTTDLLRGRVGFNVIGDGSLARVINTRGRCTPVVFIDGEALVGFNLNDVSPSMIKLMITYTGFSQLPMQFQTLRGNLNCGVIAIISQ